MFENDYKAEMERVKFSEDFEKRTVERLSRELNTKKTRRRAPRAAIVLATCAAAFVLTLTLTSRLRSQAPIGGASTSENQIQVHATMMAEAQYETAADLPDSQVALSMAEPYYDGVYRYESDAVTEVYSEDEDSYEPESDNTTEYFNTSEYSYIADNRFLSAAETPLSTFAADVDTASYANVRGMLNRGETPPADSVRIEEFINYFHYDYPSPKAGEPFSVTAEIAPCPWNAGSVLLMVGLNTEPIDTSELPPSNLVFLIDVSGSMDEPDKLPLCQKAFSLLTEQLGDEDTVSIVTYAGSDQIVLDGVSGRDKPRIMDAVNSLMAGGSTAGASGINTAYELAQKHFIEGGNNRVILATDGDLNVGVSSEGELTRLIEEKRETGVYLSVLGFGYGNYKDNKLQALADHGNGNYSYIDDAYEAKKVLVEEMGATLYAVCKDAKFQVEFNPEKVSEYRLIGYEQRKMDDRDFADDLKDGGEIGAGHSVTALYELKLNHGEDSADTGLKYQTGQTTGSSDYLTINIRAKKPDGDVSEEYSYPIGEGSVRTDLSDNMAFAASVCEFGMILRDSEYKGTSTYQSAAELLTGIDNLSGDPYKDEYAYILRRLARQE